MRMNNNENVRNVEGISIFNLQINNPGDMHVLCSHVFITQMRKWNSLLSVESAAVFLSVIVYVLLLLLLQWSANYKLQWSTLQRFELQVTVSYCNVTVTCIQNN